MAWTGYVETDADKSDVGIATAVWNEGQETEFRYSRRAKLTQEEGAAFVAEAKAALSKHQSQNSRNSNLSTTLTNLLNG